MWLADGFSLLIPGIHDKENAISFEQHLFDLCGVPMLIAAWITHDYGDLSQARWNFGVVVSSRGNVCGSHTALADHVSLPGDLGCEIPDGADSQAFFF